MASRAATVLGVIGPKAAAAVGPLTKALTRADSFIPSRAAEALGRIGPAAAAAVPTLIDALTRSDFPIDGASEGLAGIGKPAVPALIKLLKSRDPGVVMNAAWTLGQIGEDAAPAVPALVNAMTSPGDYDEKHRNLTIAWALGSIGPKARAATAALVRLDTGTANARCPLALCRIQPDLGKVLAAAKPSLERIADFSSDYAGLELLGVLGPALGAPVPVATKWQVRSILGDLDTHVDENRVAAEDLLVEIGPEALPHLETELAETEKPPEPRSSGGLGFDLLRRHDRRYRDALRSAIDRIHARSAPAVP